jgi:hypothetical protein
LILKSEQYYNSNSSYDIIFTLFVYGLPIVYALVAVSKVTQVNLAQTKSNEFEAQF